MLNRIEKINKLARILTLADILKTETENERDEAIKHPRFDGDEELLEQYYKKALASVYRMRNNAAALLLRNNCGCSVSEDNTTIIINVDNRMCEFAIPTIKNILQTEFDRILEKNKKVVSPFVVLSETVSVPVLEPAPGSVPITKSEPAYIPEEVSVSVSILGPDPVLESDPVVVSVPDTKLVSEPEPETNNNQVVPKETKVKSPVKGNSKEIITPVGVELIKPVDKDVPNSESELTSPLFGKEDNEQDYDHFWDDYHFDLDEEAESIDSIKGSEPEVDEKIAEIDLRPKEAPIQTFPNSSLLNPNSSLLNREQPNVSIEPANEQEEIKKDANPSKMKFDSITDVVTHTTGAVNVQDNDNLLWDGDSLFGDGRNNELFVFAPEPELVTTSKPASVPITESESQPILEPEPDNKFKLNTLKPEPKEIEEKKGPEAPLVFQTSTVDLDPEEMLEVLKKKKSERDRKYVEEQILDEISKPAATGTVFNLSTGQKQTGDIDVKEASNKIEKLADGVINTSQKDIVMDIKTEHVHEAKEKTIGFKMQSGSDYIRAKKDFLADEYNLTINICDEDGFIAKTDAARLIVVPLKIPETGNSLVTDIAVFMECDGEVHAKAVNPGGKTTISIKSQEYAVFVRGSWENGNFISVISIIGVGKMIDFKFKKKQIRPETISGIGIGHNVLYIDHITTAHIYPIHFRNNLYNEEYVDLMAIISHDYGIDQDCDAICTNGSAELKIDGERYKYDLTGKWEEDELKVKLSTRK